MHRDEDSRHAREGAYGAAPRPGSRLYLAMLVLDRIGKTYPNGVHALGGVSLEVELGEIVAVIGGSGCGKSTLLRAIAGLDPASEGAVFLDGERIGAVLGVVLGIKARNLHSWELRARVSPPP